MKDIEYSRAKYQKGFQYQLTETAVLQTKICGYTIEEKFYSLMKDGLLTARPGYSWDGASGFPDIKSIMRGSLFHDILYQMIRREQLPHSAKEPADRILQELCVMDGMWRWMAWLVYEAVHYLGNKASHPNNKRKEFIAP